MKMNMPKIRIKDSSLFAAVAMVVDHPQVEKFVKKCRAKLYFLNMKDFSSCPYEMGCKLGKDIFYKLSPEAEIYYQKLRDDLDLMNNRKNDRFYQYEKAEIDRIESELQSVSTDQLRFDKEIEDFLNYHEVPLEYKQVLQRLILNGEVRKEDYKGKPLGRWKNVKTQRRWYWQNRRTHGPSRLGYKRLGEKEGVVQKTIESGIRHYKDCLETYYGSLVLDQEFPSAS